MKKALRSIAAFYLGMSLSIFANINILNWQFWAIVIPVVLLYNIPDEE